MADVLQIQNRGNVDLNYHRSRVRHLSSSSGHELDEEDLDPRIQDELEKLNKGSDEINRLELELDEARSSFRQSLSDSTQKLNVLTKKLGSCIEKARPYYDARMRAKEAQVETQRAALRFERAMSMHEAAKEMVQLAEQGYSNKGEEFDPAWQEMLNHATMKVNEAEKERIESEQEHAQTAKFYNESDQKVQTLQKDLKRAITKSRPYFEMKAKFNQLMEEQKQMVAKLEAQVVGAKSMYSEALRNLERISDEIHQQRMEKRKHKELGIRGSGVGADSPPPPRRELGGKMDGSDIIDTECHSDTSPESFRNSADLTSSLVYSSPESARNNSYRQAIDASMSASSTYRITSPAADLDDNFDVPSLEEEYMGLPGMRPSRRSLSRSPITEGEDSVFSPLPNTQVTSRRDVVREVANSSPTSSTGSPASVRKSKLQGIILKIDSKMDSGLRHPSFNKPQRTQSMYVTAPQYYKGFNSKSGKRSADASQTENNRDQAKEGAVSTGPSPIPAPVACPAKRQVKLSLPRPSSNHDIEDTSDTESIASTGPMPDDELVEMATLDLPDEEELQQEEEEFKQSFDRDSWKRRSLPPHLNYLAQYLKDEHVGSTEPAQKQTDADLSDDRLTQEKLGLQESRD